MANVIQKLKEHRPQASLWELMTWTWNASKGVRWRVAGISALGLAKVAMSLCFVWTSKLLIDAATDPTTPIAKLWHLAGFLIAAMLLEMLLMQAYNYLSKETSTRLTNRLRHDIYGQLLYSNPYTRQRHTGDIVNRVLVDVASVVNTIVEFVPSAITMTAQLGAACWLLFNMNPSLVLCALIITPFCLVLSRIFFLKIRRLNGEIREADSRVQTHLQEGLQHRVVVQTLECAPLMMQRFDRQQETLFEKTLRKLYVSIYSRIMMRIGFLAGYLIAFIWSAFELHAGSITFGIMTAFLQLVSRIQAPISGIAGLLPSLMSTATAIDRLIEIEGDREDDSQPQPISGPIGISVNNVSFRYNEDQHEVLSHFSHDFRPGSKTAIMGETGTGKSTLTKLILALLQPTDGNIELYNDQQRFAVSAATRCNMVYVPQGNSLLAGTVRENLLLGNPDATEEQLHEVLRIAVAEFVYDLPLGLDTPCGELGSRLSEGQCQRLAIARALLRDGNLLILDEFNSSLDNQTAALLRSRLLASRPQATILFVSHKNEIAEMCDEVLHLHPQS